VPDHRKSRIALVGPAAEALSARMVAAGFDLGDGGAAVVDVEAAQGSIAGARARYSPIVGILGERESVSAEASALDALVRLPHAAADLPPLLRTLIRAADDRGELSQLRRYEDFFSHVNDGMAVLDEQGRVLTVNPAGCSILGLRGEETRGLPLPELVAKESAMEASLLWRELAGGGRVLSADLSVHTKDGRTVTLAVSAGPLRSQNGHAILSFRDVSERRELESELRKTKEFLERLIHATPDGIVAADLQGTLLLFNKGAERMTGFPASGLVGKWNIRELYPPGLAEEMMRRLREARAAGEESGRVRCEIVARSGEVIPVDLSAAIVSEDGRDTATVGVFRDLREELRRESELRKTRERLEQAEKAAVVSALAGAAAHELNQPLTSVLGFSELLFRRTGEQDKGREELAAILREAERMAQIVKKIGRITRYETTAYVGRTRIVDLERASNPPPVVIRDKP
jgi:PAS domain S-box-containing protein